MIEYTVRIEIKSLYIKSNHAVTQLTERFEYLQHSVALYFTSSLTLPLLHQILT